MPGLDHAGDRPLLVEVQEDLKEMLISDKGQEVHVQSSYSGFSSFGIAAS